MSRTAQGAAALATAALLLGAAPASACSPSYGALDAPRTAAPGETIRLSGKAFVNRCPTTPPSPSPAPTVTPSRDPAIGIPLPLRPVAYVTPQRADVDVTLARPDGSGRRRIAVAKADPAEPEGSRHSFSATVTVPADVAPGTYVVEARQRDGVWYGTRELAIERTLASTGGHAADLVAVALLALVAGAGALVVSRRFA